MCLAMRVAVLVPVSVLAFSGCRSKDESVRIVVPQERDWPGFFVDGSWVAEHWEELTIVDARDVESYEQGHVHGAIHFSPEEVERHQTNGTVGLPSLPFYEDVMGEKGIGDEARLVIYGEAGEGGAVRLMWALDVYGHKRVALLVEGMEGWQEAGYPTDQVSRTLPPQAYRATLQTDRIASSMKVMEAMGQPQVGLLDLRSGSPHGKRIPSSVSLDFGKRIMEPASVAAMRELQNALGKATHQKERMLTYGNPGPRACFSYFALRDLGVEVSLYLGGWEEWSANANLPVELGGVHPIHQESDLETTPVVEAL